MTAPIAVQLYSLRDEIAESGMRAALERLAAIGYAGVEFAGFGDLDGSTVAQTLADTGLRAASAHVDFSDRDQFAHAIEKHREVGAEAVVVPFLPPDAFADRAAVSRAAEKLSEAVAVAREFDVAVGYHNHFWELKPLDDRPALAHLFAESDPALFAEVDIYWVQVGGTDPAALVAELGTRVRLLHVKDGPADDAGADMVAVGAGAVDIAGVLGSAPHAAWHVVELDRCGTDMFEAVEASFSFLVGSGLSSPRS